MKASLASAHVWIPVSRPDPARAMFASSYVRALCEALKAMGHAPLALLERVGLDEKRLYAASEWMPLEQVDAIVAEAVAMTGDPAFGLHWGELSPMMQFDLGPSLVASAPTLRQALDAVVQLQFIFANRAQCSLLQEGSRSTLAFDLLACSELGLHVLTELALVSMLRGFRYLGQLDALRRINVGYPRPAHAKEYVRLFGPKLRFGQPRTSIEFASAALERREGAHNEPLHRMLREHTSELSQRTQQQVSVVDQVEGYVRNALPRVLGVEEAARLLGQSARSLRRRLSEEQVSFSELVDRVQRDRAMKLLERKALSVKEVAAETGFQTTSGFQRAFRRWTGDSPGRART